MTTWIDGIAGKQFSVERRDGNITLSFRKERISCEPEFLKLALRRTKAGDELRVLRDDRARVQAVCIRHKFISGVPEIAAQRSGTFAPITSPSDVEIRGLNSRSSEGNSLQGYAAVFNSDSEDLGGYIERISPGAFSDVLEDDVFAVLNHSFDQVLGRNGVNLTLKEDEQGLFYKVTLPNTELANDLHVLVKDRIIRGSSFQFSIRNEKWIKGDQAAGTPHLRIIDKVQRLYDVSPVTVPAYKATSVAARSFDLITHGYKLSPNAQRLARTIRIGIHDATVSRFSKRFTI
jgi:hypothetical protein